MSNIFLKYFGFKEVPKISLLIFIDTKNKSAINQNDECFFNAIKQRKLTRSEFKLNPPLRDIFLYSYPFFWGLLQISNAKGGHGPKSLNNTALNHIKYLTSDYEL